MVMICMTILLRGVGRVTLCATRRHWKVALWPPAANSVDKNSWQHQPFLKSLSRFVFKQRSNHLDRMRASGEDLGAVFEQLFRTRVSHLPQPVIAKSEDHAADAAPKNRPSAHRARFGIDIERA